MAPELHFAALLLFFTFSLKCFAEVISLRASTKAPSLTDLQNTPNDYRFIPPISSSSDESPELNLMDIVLLASIDGQLHALNRTSGQRMWAMTSSTSSSAPSTVGPLVNTKHPDIDSENIDEEDDDREVYIIEPQSGEIFVMTSPNSPLQRLPFSMSRLVEISPFVVEDDKAKRVFVGKKETSLLVVELETGRIKAVLNSECPWDADSSEEETNEPDLDELDGTKPAKATSTDIFIGRTDYHIAIHTSRSDPTSPKIPTQNLSFSSYGPNNQDIAMQATYQRTPDDAYMQSLGNGEILAIKAPEAVSSTSSSSTSPLLWRQNFKNTIVAVFDVFRSSERPNPFVLLQPLPRLRNLFPHVDLTEAAKRNQLNTESAFIDMVEQSGALFAMSPTQFPLVAFSDFGRPARNLIEASSNSASDRNEWNVDSITKARNLRQLCRDGKSLDRRCLTGIKRLETSGISRYNRLIEGSVPPASVPPSPVLDHTVTTNRLERHSGVAMSSIGPAHGKENSWYNLTIAGTLFGISVTAPYLAAFLLALLLVYKKGPAKTSSEQPISVSSIPNTTQEALSLEPKEVVSSEVVTNGSVPPPEILSEKDSIGLTVSESDALPIKVDALIPEAEELDGDESDKEPDPSATPGKRKVRRGRRAKKKKTAPIIEEEVDNAQKQEDEKTTPPVSTVILPTPAPAVIAPSLVVSDTILGFGSHGTVVFQGALQGRAVAVKRLLQDFVSLAAREVSILQESDDHPNVIRYYYQEAQANFLYIALELCPASLADVVERPDQFRDISVTFDPKKALRQITLGLRHLHSLKVVHRDIKPQNILISAAKAGLTGGRSSHRMLISDFGLCKKLEVDQTSFLPTAHGAMAAGTVGWRAPEILRGEVKIDESSLTDDQSQSSRGSTIGGVSVGSNGSGVTRALTRLTKSVDIFALGCLFYYTLTNGGHPFGDRFEREVNIIRNEKVLDGLEMFGEEGSEAVDLISSMLEPEARMRPDTTTCLLHPFFWDSGRRLTFLQDASDRFEIMCRDPKDPNLLALEKDAFSIVGNDWHSRLDKVFIENLGKFRKYDGRSVQDLLRALRNKKHHYQDLPDHVKRQLGPMPEGFLAYFTRRFPRLFLHVHSVVEKSPLRYESMFKSYFELVD